MKHVVRAGKVLHGLRLRAGVALPFIPGRSPFAAAPATGSGRFANLSGPDALHVLIVSALGLGGAAVTGQAHASCNGSATQTLDAASYGYSWSICQGADGVDHNDEKDGAAGDDISFDASNAGTYTGGNSLPYGSEGADQNGLMIARTRGGDGVDEGAAGAGGTVTIINGGDMTLTSPNDPGSVGNLISGLSFGGDGDSDNDNYKSSGGHGGAGSAVTIANSGTLTVESLNGNTDRGMSAILGWSQGGVGGEQNSGAVGDQVGGNGGAGGTIDITNTGQVVLGGVTTLLSGLDNAWGIAAKSIGGAGGNDNGAGGAGGYITVTNGSTGGDASVGAIGVYASDTDSVRGIYALTQGSHGTASFDSTDNGGDGAAGGKIDISTYADITVVGSGVSNVSGGIVAIAQGGDGGTGYNSSDGGAGGAGAADVTNLTLQSGVTVSTQGDYVAGMVGLSQGGRGGDGASGEKDSSGGSGGTGSQIQLNNYGAIETTGNQAYGLLGQSIGGLGGNGGDDTAVLGTSGGGGYGGDAGGVGAYMTGGSSITTNGDFSAAVTLHSIGGGGGTGGDFTDVLGGGAGNGGNGGSGETATINNDGGTITTTGEHSYGILVQSIGGSGGTGGIANGLTLELGGDGGDGGSSGTASVQNAGEVNTFGYSAHGIVAQSITGGGGAAGTAGGVLSIGGKGGSGNIAGNAEVQHSGAIATDGDAAIGIISQSIGGGGGTGGGAKGIATVGGQGGAGGDGSHADVSLTGGSVATQGEMAHGIMAQSIGGGGGNGGNVIDMSLGIPAVGVGGSASGGGSGGWACVTNKDMSDDCSAGTGAPQTVTITTDGSGALGILAQSVGGGGGNGGNATGGDAGLGSFQVGGGGGGGGYANTVTVGFQGLTLFTQGSHAAGIVAQSIGGGGGTGGSASAYAADIGFTASVAVGGSGGNGGNGGSVVVDLTDSLIKTGLDGGDVTDAIGVLAQSIGGGGGSGGSSVADALTAAVPTGEDVSLAMSVSTAVGGGGGSGGDGEAVSLTLDGSTLVSTLGASSHGLVAQSIGGGGGNGGSASTLAATAGIADTVSADIGVSVGGSGAYGGTGDTVTVDLSDTAAVVTAGDYANAIVAQSIGGGGGNGGLGSVNNKQIGGGFNLAANVGVGGSGGGGGTGGTANVNLDSGTALQTSGSGARGVLAQSIGGGGGTSQGVSVGLSGSASLPGGGEEEAAAEDDGDDDGAISAGVTVSVGRTGGGGGDGGAINVTTAGGIVTTGGDADGVLAQSIGGGGGLGGSIASASTDDDDEPDDEDSSYDFTVGVGGAGGTAAHGGTVTLVHSGRITTTGDWADGIVAQSIGGGGGTAGTSSISGSQATASITIGVGGNGGGGGDGGAVDITFDDNHGNSINTSGYSAYGVLLQSIGGGGGQGGDGSDQAAGTITVGGGIGGSGGAGGDGGTVTTNGWINLSTSGDDAHGIVAQSIGGGGGVGGAGSSTAADDDDSHTVDLVIGGSGGVGGSGGAVDLTVGTTLNTYGDRAFGLVAQSIGGGGGIGGAGEADSIGSIVVGGSGGGSINGGTVTVDVTSQSTVHTRGIAAHGVVAQSIGGGGGIGGTASGAPLSFTGSSPGSYGDGGNVTVTVDGGIITDGDYSFGVLAQSIGGGGGFGGNAAGAFMGSNGNLSSDGKSGDVTVTVEAGRSIQATGEGSIGIFAQSDAGTDNNGTVNVTVSGSVAGGGVAEGSGTNGAGVWVSGGKSNTVTLNAGGSISAVSGIAVQYTAGKNAPAGSSMVVYNSGTIQGSVKGGSTVGGSSSTTSAGIAVPAAARFGHDTAVSVVNEVGGLLTDAEIYEADVANRGRLMVGHSGDIDDTRVAGDLTQGADGVLAIDADLAGSRADRLTVEGDAMLGGRVVVNASSVLPGRSATFIAVEGTLDHTLSAESSIFDYAVTRTGNELSVSAESAHFGEPGFSLSDDQDRVADHLQAIWDAGGGPFGTLFGTLGGLADGGGGGYGSALSDLSPGAVGAVAAGSIVTTQQHLDLLLSCPMFVGGTSMLVETECVWSQAGARVLDQKASGGVSGFDATTYAMQAGVQVEVAENWFAGFAGGYERNSVRGDDDRVDADGDTLYAGASLKHQAGAWLLSGAVAGSYGWYDSTRTIRIPGFAAQAEGSPDIYNLSARVRAAYTIAQEAYYVRPLVDFDLVYTHANGYRESGAGVLNLEVDDAGQWSFHATPAVEIGTRVALSDTTVMRAFAAAGVSFSSADNWETSARLAQAPAGIGTFDSQVPLADVVGRLTAGVDIAVDNGFSLRVDYQGAFSDTYTSHGGALRLGYRF